MVVNVISAASFSAIKAAINRVPFFGFHTFALLLPRCRARDMPFKFFPTAEHHLREDVLSFTGKPTSQTRSNEAAPMVKPHISMQNTAHKMQTSARSDVQRITGRGPIFAGLGPTLIE
ncbi:hypothetical protein C2E31_21155, partial [Rhodopirellula baltica]